MRNFKGVLISLAGLMLMTTPAFAADYSFETLASEDYYGSTSYEEVYGTRYNYGGINAVDFLDPLADGAPTAGVGSSSTLEYGISSGNSSVFPDSTGSGLPVEWMELPTVQASQFTPASAVMRSNGSIGTLIIPKLGIRYRAYDGTDSAAMRKGVGHFSSTSAWLGNIGICGHNRGSNYNIGAVKNLKVGDTIRYETTEGSRTYSVNYVGVIDWTDWSYLNATSDNRITIITCLADQPTKRVCVQAVEVCS
jgi:LPXTG-site transpeptidase (sortase) family protein